MTALAAIEIQTARLLLRSLVGTDAEALLEIHADARAMQYSNGDPWGGIGQARELIDRSGQWLASGRHLCLGVARRDTGHLLGTCTLYDIDRANLRAEVGFILGVQAWGAGYMTEALTALLDHAFVVLGLHRVEADTDPRNAAAIRLLERLGFQREGLLRERWLSQGRRSDAAFYGLLRGEWKRR